jgi:hypothetical protein
MKSQQSLSRQIDDFNKEVFQYEDERSHEITSLIKIVGSLQASMDIPSSAPLLTESLICIKEAETQQEMEVYRQSFLAALDATQLHDVLDVDQCINALRSSADDLFYWTSRYTEEEIKKFGEDSVETIKDMERAAETAVVKFHQQAENIQHEFENAIAANNKIIREAKLTGEELNYLQEMNLKYEAGIKRIRTERLIAEQSFEIIKQIAICKEKTKRQQLRADFAILLHQLRLIDVRTGYHHFVTKCKENINALCAARSSYLAKNESSIFKPIAEATWMTAVSPALSQIALLPSNLPQDLPRFSYDATDTSRQIKYKSQLGKRFVPHIKRTLFQRVTNFLKKAASILLGVGGLILSAIMCATGFLAPKGVALAATSVGIINTVIGGSDFITEQSKAIKRNKQIIKNLESLEKQHELLHAKLKKPLHKNSYQAQASRKVIASETKIDLLLMGHKATDILSKDEMEKIKSAHKIQPAISQENKQEPQKTQAPDETMSPTEEDTDSEGKKFKLK